MAASAAAHAAAAAPAQFPARPYRGQSINLARPLHGLVSLATSGRVKVSHGP